MKPQQRAAGSIKAPCSRTTRAQPIEAWLSHPNSSTDWEDLVQQLRRAPPVAWQTLHHTLVALQEITAQTAGPLPPAEANIPDKLAAARRSLPKATQVHLPWVLNHLTDNAGYTPAAVQETHAYLENQHHILQETHASIGRNCQ